MASEIDPTADRAQRDPDSVKCPIQVSGRGVPDAQRGGDESHRSRPCHSGDQSAPRGMWHGTYADGLA